jgi:hypothetical protein
MNEKGYAFLHDRYLKFTQSQCAYAADPRLQGTAKYIREKAMGVQWKLRGDGVHIS